MTASIYVLYDELNSLEKRSQGSSASIFSNSLFALNFNNFQNIHVNTQERYYVLNKSENATLCLLVKIAKKAGVFFNFFFVE